MFESTDFVSQNIDFLSQNLKIVSKNVDSSQNNEKPYQKMALCLKTLTQYLWLMVYCTKMLF